MALGPTSSPSCGNPAAAPVFPPCAQPLAAAKAVTNVPWDDLWRFGAAEVLGKPWRSACRFTNGSNDVQISVNGFRILSIASPRMVITINGMYLLKIISANSVVN